MTIIIEKRHFETYRQYHTITPAEDEDTFMMVNYYKDDMDIDMDDTFCCFSARLEYLSKRVCNISAYSRLPIKNAIECRRYDIVQQKLADYHSCEDPNEEILFEKVYMTGLEFSVYNHDWRMAAVFYFNAADPMYNCFDGRVIENIMHEMMALDSRSMPFLSESSDPTFTTTPNLYHISENNGMPISGFKGLYCLLNPTREDYHEMLATLWIMEKCYEDSKARNAEPSQMIRCARDCMSQIGAKAVWNKEFCHKMFIIIQSLRRVPQGCRNMGLPNEICLNILDYVIEDVLSFTLWSGLKYVSNCSVSGSMNQYY